MISMAYQLRLVFAAADRFCQDMEARVEQNLETYIDGQACAVVCWHLPPSSCVLSPVTVCECPGLFFVHLSNTSKFQFLA